MPQRFEGRNLEEALTTAAEALGVDRAQLTYTVLLEKRGFLGGVKRVVLEADVNPSAMASPVASAASTPLAPPASVAPPRSEAPSRGPATMTGRGRGGRGGRGGERGRSGNRGGGRGGQGGGGGRRRDSHDDGYALQPGDFEQQFLAEEIPQQGTESDAARSVREWCEELVDYTRLDLELRTEENDSQIIVRLYGRDSARVVDRHGELLDALQVLANKALVGRKLEKDIELDCRQFKEQRVEEIERQAHEVADRVRGDGREQLLPAMSPVERRIVHIALRDDEEVATESRGEGFFKRVAIVPRSQQESSSVAGSDSGT